jgi:hypothetical protein
VKRNRAYVLEVLRKGCVECGETDILTLEFDHREGVDKYDNVMSMVAKSQSIETIQAEMDKCDVLCGSCHNRRTQIRRDSWRLDFLEDPE